MTTASHQRTHQPGGTRQKTHRKKRKHDDTAADVAKAAKRSGGNGKATTLDGSAKGTATTTKKHKTGNGNAQKDGP